MNAHDLELLARSFITPELAGQARIYRVTSEEGAQLVGRSGHGRYAGLVFPYIWPGETNVREYRLRRDHPDLEQQPDGTHKEKAKYLSPPGRANMLYLTPGTLPEHLTDASLPVAITEGEKKVLSLYRLAHTEAPARAPRFLAVGVSGVWNWRSTVGKTQDANGARCDVKGVIPDFDRIAWQGRTVHIAFDANVATNESVGAARRGLAKELARRGAKVRFVNLPQEAGINGIDDLLAARGANFALSLFEAAPEWSDATAKKDASPLRVQCMADVEAESVAWLWHPYIALGKLTIIEGDPGLGKSWTTCALASAITHGRGLPGVDADSHIKASNVLMLSAEDGLADTLRPRFDAVGADLARIFAVDEPFTLDATGLLLLEVAIIEHTPALVVIDPLFAFTGGKVDIHRANECRAISAPLATLAARHNCAFLAVRHLSKSRGQGHALNAGIGSIDFTAAARSVLLVGRDPDDEAKRAIVQTKNNLAPHGTSQGYKLEGNQFFWTGESDLTPSRILSIVSNEDERGAQTEAVDFLRASLADGARPAKDIKTEAQAAGLTEQMLRTARTRLHVRVFKEGGYFAGGAQRWMWQMPDAEDVAEGAEDVRTMDNQHLQSNGDNKSTYRNGLAEDVDSNSSNTFSNGESTSSADVLTDEEAELAAQLEYYGATREEADATAKRMSAPVPF